MSIALHQTSRGTRDPELIARKDQRMIRALGHDGVHANSSLIKCDSDEIKSAFP
jgi:hypothetical protein